MAKQEKKKSSSLGKVVLFLVVISLLDAAGIGLIIMIGVLALIGWGVVRLVKSTGSRTENSQPRQQRAPLDDSPKPICFHRDKGMHHVIRGRGQDPWDLPNREIEPWDRPDIDIRKYQRR